MNATDMREVIEAVVAACDADPEKTASDALVELADSRGEDAENCVLVTYRIDRESIEYDIFEDFELMQRAWWVEFKRRFIVGNEPITFRGINRDGSDVICTWDKLHTTTVQRGWHADEVADVAVAMLMHPVSVDIGHLFRMVSDYALVQTRLTIDSFIKSCKRAECEDAELPLSKRVAADAD